MCRDTAACIAELEHLSDRPHITQPPVVQTSSLQAAAGGYTAASSTSDQVGLPQQQHIWTEIGFPSMPLVCNGILCYLYCKMDVMVHNTLVKLFTDHFESKDIEAARQLLYIYDAITKLNLKEIRPRQGPAKDKTNVENILLALRRCRSGLPKFVVTFCLNSSWLCCFLMMAS